MTWFFVELWKFCREMCCYCLSTTCTYYKRQQFILCITYCHVGFDHCYLAFGEKIFHDDEIFAAPPSVLLFVPFDRACTDTWRSSGNTTYILNAVDRVHLFFRLKKYSSQSEWRPHLYLWGNLCAIYLLYMHVINVCMALFCVVNLLTYAHTWG